MASGYINPALMFKYSIGDVEVCTFLCLCATLTLLRQHFLNLHGSPYVALWSLREINYCTHTHKLYTQCFLKRYGENKTTKRSEGHIQDVVPTFCHDQSHTDTLWFAQTFALKHKWGIFQSMWSTRTEDAASLLILSEAQIGPVHPYCLPVARWGEHTFHHLCFQSLY